MGLCGYGCVCGCVCGGVFVCVCVCCRGVWVSVNVCVCGVCVTGVCVGCVCPACASWVCVLVGVRAVCACAHTRPSQTRRNRVACVLHGRAQGDVSLTGSGVSGGLVSSSTY